MWNRRRFVATAGMTAALGGCLGDGNGDGNGNGNDDGQNGADTDGTSADEDDNATGYDTGLDELEAYDPVDRTGEDEVNIRVDPDGEGRFEPDPVVVERLATVKWTWGEPGYEIYPIDIPDPCRWSGNDTGAAHAWQFPFVGKYEIGCSRPDGDDFTGVMFVVEPGFDLESESD
ncbi:hypothetical protein CHINAEXTREME_18290 [Halobiforma lacisalsi AJ5]|uniref:Plastocyanin n=2 Tax=Natronobacterium lacisalsi TaxID=229731 RepID=M0LR96_NATLA|nr:hypothetical protein CHINAEXTREME_18290 [Halobiforma lacisalsi AJ5]EMA35618.1 hypothetical protein C445_05278 [Halobiforma lacisalsi AJ5]